MASRELDDLSRAELRQLAQHRALSGRSSMNKAELITSLRRSGATPDQLGEAGTGDSAPTLSRTEAFSRLAEARSRGEMVFLPRHLTGHERRKHVRQTIREDHESRIASRDHDAVEKFEKLADSAFSFFRGTCLLFYRDMAGEDAEMPTVLTLGDVHPENFGVMPSADNVPIFGVNDFDEAYYAPFTWDLKRGATGFMIGAGTEGGHGPKQQLRIAEAFVRGYVEAMQAYADDASENQTQWRADNAPKIVRELIQDSLKDRDHWLAKKYHDEHRRGFRADDELVPVSSRVEEFQELLHRFVADNEVQVPARAGDLRVKDVCQRLGGGTASLGLPRYFLLVEGPEADGTDDLVLELKQARRSALAGLVPHSGYEVDGHAERISHAQGVHLVRGDRFYGAVELDGLSFLVRERAPYRGSIDVDELSGKGWRTYARVCGRSLAQSHALSDEAGLVDHDVEPDVVAAIGPPDLFVTDVLAYAADAAERVRADHQHFRADHALGAFRALERVYL